jgi:hypothetical protein
MLSFMTSQAVALSQARPRLGKQQQSTSAPLPTRKSKHLFARVFEALAESRMRKAELEARFHRSMWHPVHPSKD